MFFPTLSTEAGFIFSAALAGIGYGALLGVFPSITADYYGLKNYGTNYGALYTAWGVSGFIGPVIAAFVVDSTGTYTMAYSICGSMLAIAAVLSFFVKPVSRKDLEGSQATEAKLALNEA